MLLPENVERVGQDMPRISVLMPVYNTADYLAEAVDSILGQTFGDFEFLVIDDGSTDGSTALLQELASHEPRIVLTLRENQGVIATRNELLHSASGEFVAWMDSDDLSVPNRLAVQLEAFRVDPALLCIGSAAQCIDPAGQPLNIERNPLAHDAIVADQRHGGGMRFPTTMMRRDAALAVGGFREPFRIGEDLDLFLRLGERGKLANLDQALYIYRHHLSSTSSQLATQWLVYRDQILALADERRSLGTDKLQRGETVTIELDTRFSRKHQLADTLDYWAKAALANGDRRSARGHAFAAVRVRPLMPRYWWTLTKALV